MSGSRYDNHLVNDSEAPGIEYESRAEQLAAMFGGTSRGSKTDTYGGFDKYSGFDSSAASSRQASPSKSPFKKLSQSLELESVADNEPVPAPAAPAVPAIKNPPPAASTPPAAKRSGSGPIAVKHTLTRQKSEKEISDLGNHTRGRASTVAAMFGNAPAPAQAPMIRRRSRVEYTDGPSVQAAAAPGQSDVTKAVLAARKLKRELADAEASKKKAADAAKATPREKALANLRHNTGTNASSGSPRPRVHTSVCAPVTKASPPVTEASPPKAEPVPLSPSKVAEEAMLSKKATMRARSSTESLGDIPTNLGNKCVVCLKPAYAMEKVEADGNRYHSWCFRCCECDKKVSVGKYAALKGKLYCKPCFKKLFKLNGNYSNGFGEEQHKMKWIKGEMGGTSSP